MSIQPADLFLSADLSEEEACGFLQARGLGDPAAADRRLQGLASDLASREAMARLAELLFDVLGGAADPDLAVEVFAHLAGTRVPRAAFLRYLHDDPRALDVLIGAAGSSAWLGELLVASPEHFHWLVREMDRPAPDAADLASDVDHLLARAPDARAARDLLRGFRDRELLRIGGRDLLGRDSFELTIEQLSDLADTVVARAFALAERASAAAAGLAALPGRVAVLALGRLGGRETDYGVDLSLACVIEPDEEADRAARAVLQGVGQRLAAVLAEAGDRGLVYRVQQGLGTSDGNGGSTRSFQQWACDLDGNLDPRDRLALVKARPVAGDAELAARFLDLLQRRVYGAPQTFGTGAGAPGVAPGLLASCREGAEEIEQFVSALHMIHDARHPETQWRNTLATLTGTELIAGATGAALAGAYRFLRTVEHRWQLIGGPDDGPADELRAAATCARQLGLGTVAALESEVARQCRVVQEHCHAVVAPSRSRRTP
jgi:[glutamine synthetase] adenylyltransferase / [glutamine synthetase]-adenylyl-L-tyrosine phosphorylase